MKDKALRLLIFNTSAVERQRFERKAVRSYPPALSLSRERGGGSGGYILQSALGDTSSRASVDEAGKMGALLVTVSRRYTKTPLRFLPETVFCVRLTVHLIVVFLYALVKGDII